MVVVVRKVEEAVAKRSSKEEQLAAAVCESERLGAENAFVNAV